MFDDNVGNWKIGDKLKLVDVKLSQLAEECAKTWPNGVYQVTDVYPVDKNNQFEMVRVVDPVGDSHIWLSSRFALAIEEKEYNPFERTEEHRFTRKARKSMDYMAITREIVGR